MTGCDFLIFSLARTGSTSLAIALSAHPAIRCIREPFNKAEHGDKYISDVVDEASLGRRLDEIRLRFNGIKHVWEPDGWPFGLRPGLNRFLVGLPDQKVVILGRRNSLKRLVSVQISLQANVWQVYEEGSPDRFRDFRFQPLDIDLIRSQLTIERQVMEEYCELANRRSAGVIRVWYEDLFPESDSSGETGLWEISKILRFLNFRPADEQAVGEMLPFLTGQAQLNSNDTYSRIPDIHEVERLCGSNETGWLFND